MGNQIITQPQTFRTNTVVIGSTAGLSAVSGLTVYGDVSATENIVGTNSFSTSTLVSASQIQSTGATGGQVLTYNASTSTFVASGGGFTINTPVSTSQIQSTGATSGQVLTYNGSGWSSAAAPMPFAPAGTVIYVAMTAAPAGWLVCNGVRVDLSVYPNLTAIYVGDAGNSSSTISYGKRYTAVTGGSLSTTGSWISLPDLRGQFIRGWNGSGGTSGSIDTGRVFGALQTSQNLSHGHTVNDPGHTHTYTRDGDANITGGTAGSTQLLDTNEVSTVNRTTGSNTTGITINNDGGTEARPHNIALLPCIKF